MNGSPEKSGQAARATFTYNGRKRDLSTADVSIMTSSQARVEAQLEYVFLACHGISTSNKVLKRDMQVCAVKESVSCLWSSEARRHGTGRPGGASSDDHKRTRHSELKGTFCKTKIAIDHLHNYSLG